MATKAAKGGIEGTGFNIGDLVTVDHCGVETNGLVENVLRKGTDKASPIDHVDVRIDHKGHKEHGRVVTFHMDDVTPREKESKKAESA
jgi:hypothetical protein